MTQTSLVAMATLVKMAGRVLMVQTATSVSVQVHTQEITVILGRKNIMVIDKLL